MQTLEIILTQVVISLVVVALYHLWTSRNKQPASPNLNLNPDHLPNQPSLNKPSYGAASPLAVPSPLPSDLSRRSLGEGGWRGEGQGEVRVSSAEQSAIRHPPSAIEPAPPEIVAAIAAAITVVLGPHRVVAIQQVAAPAPELNVWALEGRMKHFMSHKVR
jgi:hypothetical protein